METAQRIIVGIDGSPASTAALRWAVRQARLTGRSVLAVSVRGLDAKPPSSTPMPITRPTGADPVRERHVHHLRTAVQAVDQEAEGVVVDQFVPTGEPGRVLAELSADADALVLGGHGYRRTGLAVVGSVAAHCLRHARCPVTVIPFAAVEAAGAVTPGSARESR
ncbi:universal stress protein [Umezawaea endophytica]|uniref:Universal stress protein n=1 Tax=Umezawaea endophytica TaxID=1654476 RepID=A0A9X2VQ31_9PSEU|nr:universal stress protein [Umezawaea endophytica]MCS7479363.1 universal stress protein [Umezawaea endophytica]